MNRSFIGAGTLLTLSGVTHLAQLFVYEAASHVIGAALFGAAYLVIGLLLLRKINYALWLGSILPLIGGILAAHRFIYLQVNPFSVFHIVIDLAVIPLCIHGLIQYHRLSRLHRPASEVERD